MLYADLDGLKKINDCYGHREGDKTLTDTGLILRETLRSSDIIAQIGCDEFVVIPVEVTDTSADAIRKRLEKAIGALNPKRKVGYTLLLRSGTAYYDPGKPATIEELLEEAEKSMYEMNREKLQRKVESRLSSGYVRCNALTIMISLTMYFTYNGGIKYLIMSYIPADISPAL